MLETQFLLRMSLFLRQINAQISAKLELKAQLINTVGDTTALLKPNYLSFFNPSQTTKCRFGASRNSQSQNALFCSCLETYSSTQIAGTFAFRMAELNFLIPLATTSFCGSSSSSISAISMSRTSKD